MKRAAVLIKKYGNRRLYDTTGSRYVNLDDIAALIREGKDVRVVDANNDQDLTRVTLTQIITEDAREKPTGLPLELLRQLVVATDEVRQEFVAWYLKSAFDAFQNVQDAVQKHLIDAQAAILSPVDAMKKLVGMRPAAPEDSGSEVEALRKRVAELETRLEKTRARKPRARSRR